jgi:hypothetical protein
MLLIKAVTISNYAFIYGLFKDPLKTDYGYVALNDDD